MKVMVLLSLFLVIIGCSNERNPSTNEIINSPETYSHSPDSSQADPKASAELVETEVEDVTFQDYILPTGLIAKRELIHVDTDATFVLHEFEMGSSLDDVNDWVRSESTRLGGKIIERYSYNIDTESNLDVIIELPTKAGTRIISTYTQKYIDKQHIVFEETLFKETKLVNQDYEDHALVVYTPMVDGATKESFKGNYFHQHTDIFSVYFYSQAFFKELIEVDNYKLDLGYDMTIGELDYVVGYFDKLGIEMDIYDLTDENRLEFTFGIQLKNDFLPKEMSQRELLLYHWAKTILLGDKAASRVFDGSEQINFLFAGDVFKSYTLKDLV
jgi:hypothetical protein